MEYESIFDFLKDDERFSEVYNMCISMEKSMIINAYNASLILARTASELTMKELIKNSDYCFDFYEKNELGEPITRSNGSYKYIKFYEMIKTSKDKQLIGNNVKNRYHYIRKIGNSNVHGETLANYGIVDCKKAHKNLFFITLQGYNKLNNDNKQLKYENKFDNYDFTIQISQEERENEINNIRFEEISKEDLISSYKSKDIFIPINSFKSIYEKYENQIKDKDKFIKDLDDFEYVNYENLDFILNYFDESVRNDISKDIYKLHDDIANNVFKTLDELNKSNLTFEELYSLIDEADNSNQKEIYSNIKTLADDLVKNYMEEYIKEIQSSPITDYADNGRKLLKYKNYDIIEDEYGFSLKEVDENIFLDDDQIKAVEYDGEKPLIINAGPGSGKTRVIIERVVHLVKSIRESDEKSDFTDKILVITFTRKAAQELKERLINETDLTLQEISKIRVSTVHGFCRYLISKYEPLPYNFLSRHGERSLFFKKYKPKLGFTKYAFLYDEWIPTVLEKYDEYFTFKVKTDKLVNYLEQKMSPYDSNNRKYEWYIDRFYKNNLEEEYPVYSLLKKEGLSGPSFYYRWLNIAKSYPEFLNYMEKTKTCDDNLVLAKANEILENKAILENLPFKHILIDEFQDTDYHQKEIFDKLFEIADSFTIVGDADQSIYGWRGAYPEYFEDFPKGNGEVVTLHNNYRSTRNIVEFNEELIKNKRKNPKDLRAKKKYKAPVYHMYSKSVEDEASKIAELILNLKNDGKIKYYSDVAVLFRQNFSVDNLIKPLTAQGIDFILKENNDFLEQDEVRAILTLIWYVMPYDKYKLNHLGDDFLNLYGFTNKKYESNKIFRLSDKTMNLLNKIQSDFEKSVSQKAKIKYSDVFNLNDKMKKEIIDEINPYDIAKLNREELINLGITDDYDLNFFLELKNIKYKVSNHDNKDDFTTLKLFYELLNLTDYFSEISLENNPNDLKIKDNLALFSHIIKDYESIMGNHNFEGLFEYLSHVLKGYSCRQNEFDEGFNKVHLLSMHAAKGLEYPVVIVGSIKKGICPLNYRRENGFYPTPNEYLEYKEDDLLQDEQKYDNEELRTIYVATSRAKEILILSSIGNHAEDVPDFLYNIKRNSDIPIEMLEPYNLTNMPKIESSKVFKQTNDFPQVKFENILDDFLYCGYRYDLANNTRFKVNLKNDKYVDIVLHKLLNSVHGDDEISAGKIDAKIKTIKDYHNIKELSNADRIIGNVIDYWLGYGKHYKIVENNIKVFSQLKYCDLHSVIDLVIEEEDKISIVHFVGSDESISDIDLYMTNLMYYFTLLKDIDKFKDCEFNKIYLHSLKNNKRHEKVYNEELEEGAIEIMDYIIEQIYKNEFSRDGKCENCEYFNSVCKG